MHMAQHDKLRKMVDEFNFEILDDYKIVTQKIKEESGFLGMFKKKQYDKHIRKLTDLRKRAGRINVDSIEANDELMRDICFLLKRVIADFDKLAGAQLNMQSKLKAKAEGDKSIKMSDVSPYMKIINETTDKMNKDLRKLDIRWADFLEVYV